MDKGNEYPNGVDVDRLNKPDAEAFRSLARALGATFAGDRDASSDAPTPANDAGGTLARLPRAGSVHAITAADPKRARLLDRVPIPLIVADGDSIAYINRTALGVLGYGSAAILDATGGLGALLGNQCGQDGLVTVRTGAGRSSPARVEMAAIEWSFSTALLLSIIPIDAPQHRSGDSSADPSSPMDALVALLGALPIPVALVSRAGEVDAANRAFVALGPNDRAVLRLDERLNPADLRHLMETVRLSFADAEGSADTVWPLTACGSAYWVSVGVVAGGPLACVSFHPYCSAAEDHEPDGARLVALAESAVGEVRRLIGEASVLLIHRRAGRAAALSDGDILAVQCVRTVLLSAAAKAHVGSVLTLESSATAIALSLNPSLSARPFDGVISERVDAMAADAGLQLRVGGSTITIATSDPSQSLRRA